MNKLTAQEIISKLTETYDQVDDFAYQGAPVEVAGPNTRVHSTGGEDEGSYWCAVHYFPDHDVYLKVTGYYQSYSGTDFDDGWDCVTEVRPVEKTITVYE